MVCHYYTRRIQWRHSLKSFRMKCVRRRPKVAYLVCSMGVFSIQNLKLEFCILISCVYTLHSKAIEWMTSLYPFWCSNGRPLKIIGKLQFINPFTPRVSYGDKWGASNFSVCGIEILWCDHSNETSSAVLLHGTIYIEVFCKMKFEMCLTFWFKVLLGVKGLINSLVKHV